MAEHDWKVDMIIGPDGILGHEEEAEPSRGREVDGTLTPGGKLAEAITLGVGEYLRP